MKAIALPLLAVLLCACTEPTQPRTAAPGAPAFQPTASIQDLMASIVEPSADVLWNAVSSEVTAKGVEEQQPRTAEQWQAVRRQAIALQEAGNLLLVRGRAVVHPGKVTEDAGVEGVSTPEQVQAAIAANQAAYDAAARLLHDTAAEAVRAIDKRDVQALVLAGERIDQACEQCHSTFWYPNAKEPGAAWPAKIAPPAAR